MWARVAKREVRMAEFRYEQANRIFRGADAPAIDRLDPQLSGGELPVHN
jgi:hypothetical protein